MIPINSTFAPLQVFVDELARFGMAHAVTCPGSRNAPIALTLAAHPDINAVSVVDERSAGFVALGIAKEIGGDIPVAVTTTSGTAAANLLPAVVEAHEAAIPLIVLTGDRPPELREVGAGQAIDQIKLYGPFVKWFVEVGNHLPGRASAIHHRQLGCRAAAVATSGRPGPVHLNFPLREPLAPRREEGLDPADWEGRDDGRPWTDLGSVEVAPGSDAENELSELLAEADDGLVVCGGGSPEMTRAALELGRRLGWPVLAEPTSGARNRPPVDPDPVIAHYDLLLRSGRFASERPDLVVRFGEMPTSKPLRAWLEGCRQAVIDPHLDWHEPTRTAESIWPIGPEALLALLPNPRATASANRGAGASANRGAGASANPGAAATPGPAASENPGVATAANPGAAASANPGAAASADARPGAASAWLQRWRAADALVEAELAATDEPFEPLAYGVLTELAEIIWVSSSLPIRDIESYFPRTLRPLRILSNRGANGIDGVVSSAAGASIAANAPVHLIIGELALLHDIGGLVSARRAAAQLAILCVNNGGGGIFDFLPVADQAETGAYEEHVATPVEFDLATAAALGGLEHHVATDASGVRQHLRPGTLVEFRIDRATSLKRHRELAARIVARLDAELG